MKNNLLSATIIGGILLFSNSPSHASDPAAEAISLAKLISERSIVESSTPLLRPELATKRIQAQRHLMDRLQDRRQDDVNVLIEHAMSEGVNHLDLYQNTVNLIILENDKADKIEAIEKLERATHSDDWQRRYLANLFLGSNFIHERDSLKALSYARNALEAIPARDASMSANDARYETYDLLHTAFTVDRNVDKMVEATKKLLEYGDKTGREIDYIPIIHNLGYLFSKSQDFESASKISELLMSIQDGQPDYQRAIANYSHGSNLLEAEQYAKAVPYLENATSLSGGTRFGFAAKIRLALAYAKTGQTKRSQNLISQLENGTQERATVERMQRVLSLAKAENSLRSNDYKNAYHHLNAWSSSHIEELELLLSEDRRHASEGLALSERVAHEREERLQYEVTASKEIAKRGNMIAIFAGLLAIALGFIALNLHRQRKRQIQINAELAVARDRALAGEKTKSKFLSMMGHELRTPMNPIISLADILYTRSQDADIKQMLRMISASGRTMLSMVENILIVADETKRKLKISTQKAKIRDFIRFTCTGFQRDAEDKGLNFIVNIDENVPEHMDIDKLKLKSILTNTLSNAVKFTEKGSVYLSILMVQDPHLGTSLLMSVKDTGSGMTQDEVNEILGIFEQHDATHTKTYDGVGVGLYVTELYTKAHGGRMAITSHPQDGTRIDIYIPYDAPPQVQLAA